jgi:hypothetical protein
MNDDRLRELIAGLDLQTDLWWLVMLLSGLASAVLAAFAFAEAALFWAYLAVFVRLAVAVCLAQQPWGAIFGKLLALGLVVGVFEIFSDYLLVRAFPAGRLIYPEGGALLLETPLYVPLAWACWVVELGYPIVRIYGIVQTRWPGQTGLGIAMVAGGLLCALTMGSAQVLGAKAGLFSYRQAHRMIGGVFALYVAAGEGLAFGAFLPLFARYVGCAEGRVYAAIRYGIIFAGIVFLSYSLAYAIIEGPFV